MSKVMVTVTASSGETQRLWVTLEDDASTFAVSSLRRPRTRDRDGIEFLSWSIEAIPVRPPGAS